jgi:KaiC domain protein
VAFVTEDDDWFERALEEDDASGSEPGETGNESSETESARPDESTERETEPVQRDPEPSDADPGGVGDPSEFDAEDDGPGDGGEFGMGDGEFSDDDSGASETPSGGSGDGSSVDDGDSSVDGDSHGVSSGGFADADPYDGDGDGDDGELFDEGFASAFENVPGGGMSGETNEDIDGGFGGGEGGGGSGGDGGFGGPGDEFKVGSDDGFGGGDGPFEDDSFDDEEFESSIPRIDVGIEGLDDMIQGGVPERSLLTTVGSAGTGKTTFGLQFLHEALEQGEKALFITLEESHDRIVNTATEKGWAFDEYEETGQLAVIDLDPIEMANSLTSIRNDLPRLVEQFGASRLVLDSVSLLEMMYDDQATRRNEVYDFTKSLKQAGVTTMLTSEASEDNAYASRHGIIEYLVDGVFILRYIRGSDDFRETRLAVEIQKIRDANHSREIKPYSITNEGISVYRQANIF